MLGLLGQGGGARGIRSLSPKQSGSVDFSLICLNPWVRGKKKNRLGTCLFSYYF